MSWTLQDDAALQSIFDLCWDFFNTEFEVLGYTTSWWKLAVTVFSVWLIFRIARGLLEL